MVKHGKDCAVITSQLIIQTMACILRLYGRPGKRAVVSVSSEVFSGVYIHTVHHIWAHEAVRHDIFSSI